MAQNTESGSEQPETIGSPTEYADAAEMPQAVQTAVKAFACLPAALSMVSIVVVALVVLAVCAIVTLALLF